jgi:hypothetical protein
LFPVEAYLIKSREEYDFCLTAIVNQYSCGIPFIDVYCDYHCICVWEGYELDIGFGESYRHM